MDEAWKDIPGFEGVYQASDQGRIRSLDRTYIDCVGRRVHRKGRLLKVVIRNTHPGVLLSVAGRQTTYTIARLVALTFLDSPPAELVKPRVIHTNGNLRENRVFNLRWGTHSEAKIIARKSQYCAL